MIEKEDVKKVQEIALATKYPNSRTHYYWWYGRFAWFGFTVFWGIAGLIEWDQRIRDKIIICGAIAIIHQFRWIQMKERFALKQALEKFTQGEPPASGYVRSAAEPKR